MITAPVENNKYKGAILLFFLPAHGGPIYVSLFMILFFWKFSICFYTHYIAYHWRRKFWTNAKVRTH